MLNNFKSLLFLKRYFYLLAVIFIFSSLMATVIVLKLSPMESIKYPHTAPIVEWSTVENYKQIEDSDLTAQMKDQRYNEIHDTNSIRVMTKSSSRANNKISYHLNYNNSTEEVKPNYNVHIFYYAWYRSKNFDGAWKFWNHDYLPTWKKNDKKIYPDGSHEPPADIGSNYYPVLGCYSSMDPQVLNLHMKQIRDSGVGVVVIWWSPPTATDNTDSVMFKLLDAAQRHQLKVVPQISSYEGRNPINLLNHIKYLIDQYSLHPALYRLKKKNGTSLPVIYIYDSYVFPSNAWWELLSEHGNLTLRGTELDAFYIGLLVEPQHKNHIKRSHFDGFYTYFAINNFSFGSSWKNWKDLYKFAEHNGLLFIPSIGPGYIDTRVRPWNKESTKHRRHGKYYEAAWRNVLNSGATTISITSFNQWHEGTQIEPAKSASDKDYTYLDYEPEGPNFYLNLTKWWIQQFTNKYQEVY